MLRAQINHNKLHQWNPIGIIAYVSLCSVLQSAESMKLINIILGYCLLVTEAVLLILLCLLTDSRLVPWHYNLIRLGDARAILRLAVCYTTSYQALAILCYGLTHSSHAPALLFTLRLSKSQYWFANVWPILLMVYFNTITVNRQSRVSFFFKF